MKIAFLSFYSGVVARGVETYVHELSNRLVGLGNDVTVFQNGDKLPGTKYRAISIDTKVDWNKKGSYISFINYYALRVKEFTGSVLEQIDDNTDIIFPTNGQWQSTLCSLWAKHHQRKIVISGQSGPGFDDRINLLTFPNVFVSLTNPQRKWAKVANPFVRGEVIPNGVDINVFNSKIKPFDFGLPKPIILCVAAFDFWKRQDLAIKAVSKLGKASLVLVGKGSREKRLMALGEKLLPGRFKIISFPHHEMPKVYAGADLFTYPTVSWESFGIVMAEAMATNLPVVANNDPIRREIVGDAGILADPTNTSEYAAALEKALRTNWGEKPRKQAEKFSWDEIAKKYEDLFNSLKRD